jgi:hypothetical protein
MVFLDGTSGVIVGGWVGEGKAGLCSIGRHRPSFILQCTGVFWIANSRRMVISANMVVYWCAITVSGVGRWMILSGVCLRGEIRGYACT